MDAHSLLILTLISLIQHFVNIMLKFAQIKCKLQKSIFGFHYTSLRLNFFLMVYEELLFGIKVCEVI